MAGAALKRKKKVLCVDGNSPGVGGLVSGAMTFSERARPGFGPSGQVHGPGLACAAASPTVWTLVPSAEHLS